MIERTTLIFTILTFVISYFTLLVAWKIPTKIFRMQMFVELLKEYRSREMGNAIEEVMSFYKTCDKNLKRVMDDYEINQKKKVLEKLEYSKTLDCQRRIVMQFFDTLRLVGFNDKSKKLRSDVRKYFRKEEAEICLVVIAMTVAKQRINKNETDKALNIDFPWILPEYKDFIEALISIDHNTPNKHR